jgi:ribonuclease T2
MGRLQFSRLAYKATAAFSFILILDRRLAQEHRQRASQSDYYILALSWSPSYCEARQDRARNRFQIGTRRSTFSFVVHGWLA